MSVYRESRECPKCETMTVFTNPQDFSKWSDRNGCPACSKETDPDDQEPGDQLVVGGIQVSVNGVPVRVLRWETVLTHSVGPGGVPAAFDSGRRVVEIELPGEIG